MYKIFLNSIDYSFIDDRSDYDYLYVIFCRETHSSSIESSISSILSYFIIISD